MLVADLLSKLSNPFASRYDSMQSDIEEEKEKRKLSLDKNLEASAAPGGPSVQQAVLSGALQLLPGVLGYAIGGNAGGVAGLQGGALGNDQFMRAILEEQERRRTLAGQQADRDQAQIDRLDNRSDNLELKELGLEQDLYKDERNFQQEMKRMDVQNSHARSLALFKEAIKTKTNEELSPIEVKQIAEIVGAANPDLSEDQIRQQIELLPPDRTKELVKNAKAIKSYTEEADNKISDIRSKMSAPEAREFNNYVSTRRTLAKELQISADGFLEIDPKFQEFGKEFKGVLSFDEVRDVFSKNYDALIKEGRVDEAEALQSNVLNRIGDIISTRIDQIDPASEMGVQSRNLLARLAEIARKFGDAGNIAVAERQMLADFLMGGALARPRDIYNILSRLSKIVDYGTGAYIDSKYEVFSGDSPIESIRQSIDERTTDINPSKRSEEEQKRRELEELREKERQLLERRNYPTRQR